MKIRETLNSTYVEMRLRENSKLHSFGFIESESEVQLQVETWLKLNLKKIPFFSKLQPELGSIYVHCIYYLNTFTLFKYFWGVFKYISKYSPSYSNKYKQQKVCCLCETYCLMQVIKLIAWISVLFHSNLLTSWIIEPNILSNI